MFHEDIHCSILLQTWCTEYCAHESSVESTTSSRPLVTADHGASNHHYSVPSIGTDHVSNPIPNHTQDRVLIHGEFDGSNHHLTGPAHGFARHFDHLPIALLVARGLLFLFFHHHQRLEAGPSQFPIPPHHLASLDVPITFLPSQADLGPLHRSRRADRRAGR